MIVCVCDLACRVGTIIIHILRMRILRLGGLRDLAKVT